MADRNIFRGVNSIKFHNRFKDDNDCLIYLSDCGPKDGAFHCVSGFHHQIASWMEHIPEGVHPRAHAQCH